MSKVSNQIRSSVCDKVWGKLHYEVQPKISNALWNSIKDVVWNLEYIQMNKLPKL